MRAAVAQLLTPETRAFGTRAWGEDGLSQLQSAHGHAYVGYVDMALGMLRLVDPAMPTDTKALHDALTAALARRLVGTPHGLIETFPGVTFPADVASTVGALGLHATATGEDHRSLIESWTRVFRRRYIDPGSGFVYQTADPDAGRPTGPPRGSGTARIVYFVSFADRRLARELDAAIARNGVRSWLGFGGIAEYPSPNSSGSGDIDSGPVVLGVSVAASSEMKCQVVLSTRDARGVLLPQPLPHARELGRARGGVRMSQPW